MTSAAMLLHPDPLTPPFTPLLLCCVDYTTGFGGRYGVQADRVDQSAVGFDYQGKTEKHESQKGLLNFHTTQHPSSPAEMSGKCTLTHLHKRTHATWNSPYEPSVMRVLTNYSAFLPLPSFLSPFCLYAAAHKRISVLFFLFAFVVWSSYCVLWLVHGAARFSRVLWLIFFFCCELKDLVGKNKFIWQYKMSLPVLIYCFSSFFLPCLAMDHWQTMQRASVASMALRRTRWTRAPWALSIRVKRRGTSPRKVSWVILSWSHKCNSLSFSYQSLHMADHYIQLDRMKNQVGLSGKALNLVCILSKRRGLSYVFR